MSLRVLDRQHFSQRVGMAEEKTYYNFQKTVMAQNVVLRVFKVIMYQCIYNLKTFKFKFKLSFIVIPLHVGTYSGTKCRASQEHGAT